MRRHGIRLIGALLVVLAMEAGARAIMSSTTEATRWYDETTALKIDQMEVRGATDTVFVGTSSAAQAFIPATYHEATGHAGYNAALAGGTPEVMQRWVVEEVVPRLRPTTVVWGLTSLDIAPAYGAVQQDAYDSAPATRQGALAALDRWASERSVLIRERSVLRRPSAIRGPVADDREAALQEAADHLGADGERLDYRAGDDDLQRGVMRARLRGFTPDDDDIERIRSTVERLHDMDVEVILVELPVPDSYVDSHPAGSADHDRSGVALSSLATDLDVRFLDLTHGFSDNEFVDFTHLSADGASRFTMIASDALRSGRSDVVDATPSTPPVTVDPDCETITVIDEYGDPIDICRDGDAPETTDLTTTIPPDNDLTDLHRVLLDRLALSACGAPSMDPDLLETAPRADRAAVSRLIDAIDRAHADCASWDERWAEALDLLASLVEVPPVDGLRESTALAAVAIDELAVRWELARPSSASSFWVHPNEAFFTVELRRLEAAGEPVQAAAFGSSLVLRAFDQPGIHGEWSERFLNVGLASTDAEEWELVLDRVLATTDLEVAVWTTSTHRLINDTGRAACGTIPAKVTASVENRTRMFPTHGGTDLEQLLGPDAAGWPYQGTSFATSTQVFDGAGNRNVRVGTTFTGVADAEQAGRYVDPAVCDERVEALERVLTRLIDGGVEVQLVVLPVHSAYVELAPEVHLDAVMAIEGLAEKLDVPLLTYAALADDETEDGLHANAAGRARLTDGLLEVLPSPP